MSNANEPKEISSAVELNWDKNNDDELSEPQALRHETRGEQRARLIRKCHSIARDDAEKEGDSFFGIQVIE